MSTLVERLREEILRTVDLDMLHHDSANRIEELEREVERLKTTPPDKREDLCCVIADLCRYIRERDANIALLREALEIYRDTGLVYLMRQDQIRRCEAALAATEGEKR